MKSLTLISILFFFIFNACLEPTVYHKWLISWQLLNKADSTFVSARLPYVITITPAPEGYAIHADSTTLEGLLYDWITLPGDSDDPDTMRVEIFHNESTIFDSLYKWKLLHFITADDGFYHIVNYDTLFIVLPDSSIR